MLSKMLACFTLVKLLNSSTFRVTAVWAATAVELEIGIDPAVLKLRGKQKLQQAILQTHKGDFSSSYPEDLGQLIAA